MTNTAPSFLDNYLLKLDSNYPIYGSYLEKLNFISMNMNRIEKEFNEVDVAAIHKEKEDLLVRAQAESPRRIGRLIQYFFSFYPYERN